MYVFIFCNLLKTKQTKRGVFFLQLTNKTLFNLNNSLKVVNLIFFDKAKLLLKNYID